MVATVNPAAERILGRTADETVGHDYRDVLPLVDAQGNNWWDCTRPYDGLPTRTRQPERLLVLPGVGGDRDRELLMTASYVRDESRAVIRLVVMFRDTAA